MTAGGQRLLLPFQSCVVAAANTMSFASVHAGNVVPVDDPHAALPEGGVRMVRATLADNAGVDIVIALTDASADEVLSAAANDDLAETLVPVLHALRGGLGTYAGTHFELGDAYEMGIGEPIGPPETEAFTAGLYVDDDQIGNIVFVVGPGVIATPEVSTAAFPHADEDDDAIRSNSLSLLRGVEMRVTAELGRTRLPVAHVLELGPGSVIELDRVAGTPVDILVNGTVIARGEVVVIDDEYGVRITDIIGAEEAG